MRTTRLTWAPGISVNFDCFGSVWGTEPATQALLGIVEARLKGQPVDEWTVTARDGQQLRIVRVTDPTSTFLDGVDIHVIPATTGTEVTL